MKPYKHIIYTAIVLSLVAFFAANQVAAYGEGNDFTAGEDAGFVQALNDSNHSTCSVRSDEIKAESKKVSEHHAANLMNDNRSEDFINGFQAAYEKNWLIRADVNCGS